MKSSPPFLAAVLLVCTAGCGHAAAELPRAQAVGTYIGGITPDCTYTGPALASDATGAPGRRFTAREGEIKVSCRGSVYTIHAVKPTSATISEITNRSSIDQRPMRSRKRYRRVLGKGCQRTACRQRSEIIPLKLRAPRKISRIAKQ